MVVTDMTARERVTTAPTPPMVVVPVAVSYPGRLLPDLAAQFGQLTVLDHIRHAASLIGCHPDVQAAIDMNNDDGDHILLRGFLLNARHAFKSKNSALIQSLPAHGSGAWFTRGLPRPVKK